MRRLGPAFDAKEVLGGGIVDYGKKSVIVADLDSTLTVSKSPIDQEMSALVCDLLERKKLAMITGSSYEQFTKQFISILSCSDKRMANLFVFTTCATTFHRYRGGEWARIYAENLTADERKRIKKAFADTFEELGYQHPKVVYGSLIEDRGTQMTFSALGQEAPIELKAAWDPDMKRRMVIRDALVKRLPGFHVGIGGATSIDVTRKGINKAYGIRKIMEHMHCKAKDILFIGDALMRGGNDYPVRTEGVDCIQVSGPEEGKEIIREIIKSTKK